MRQLARGLGLAFLVLGAAAAVAEVFMLVASGGQNRISVGTFWYAIAANSLVGFQAAAERAGGELGRDLVLGALALPAWLVLGLAGSALWLLGRPERRGLG